MKALKALVISMALLLVAGLGMVGYGLYRNGSHPPAKAHPAEVAGEASGRLSGYFSAEVPTPAGSRLEQMAVAGDRVILRFSGADGDRILVVDPQDGHIAGTIALVPPAPTLPPK